MSEEHFVKVRRRPDGRLERILPDGTTQPLEVNTDWARVDALTEEEIHQNALDDPDNPPLTPERLATMRRIPNPKRLRLSMNLTQEQFARQFHIALGTLRDWEQGVRMPDGTAKTYLRVIEAIPEAVSAALNPEAEANTAAENMGAKTEKAARRTG